jgi:TolB-like protein/Tfp pilus assembly protein PilF
MPEGQRKTPQQIAEKHPQIEESGFKLLFVKLKKRRIIETLAAFIGGGWLLLEFVHWILVDHYHFPEKTIDITFVTILGALLSTLVWRWFAGREKPAKLKPEIILIPLVIIMTIALDINQLFHLQEPGSVQKPPFTISAPSGAPVRTLAVLPFREIAGQSADEVWGIGMTDAIISRLTSLSNLAVRPTSEILKYVSAPADANQAGRELQVESILDGTFQRAGELIRVSVQLVDCQTRVSRWARNVDLPVTDMLKFQDEMARSVVEALSIQLTNPEKADLAVPLTNSPEAYDLYFRATSIPLIDEVAGSSQAGLIHDKLNLLQLALAKDPNFAQAYLGISGCYSTLYFHAGPGDTKNSREKLERGREAAERALQLNPRLAGAYVSLGQILWAQGRFEESIRNFYSALTLAPNNAEAWYLLGHQYHFCGLLDQAEKAFRLAFELNPIKRLFKVWHAQILLYLGRVTEAEQELRRQLAANPDDALCASYLGQVLFYQGKFQEAEPILARTAERWWPAGAPAPLWLDVIDHAAYLYAFRGERNKIDSRLLEITPAKIFDGHEAFREAGIYALLGEREIALSWLRRAVELGYCAYPWYERDIRFNKLRSDREFQRILAQVKTKSDHYRALFGKDIIR